MSNKLTALKSNTKLPTRQRRFLTFVFWGKLTTWFPFHSSLYHIQPQIWQYLNHFEDSPCFPSSSETHSEHLRHQKRQSCSSSSWAGSKDMLSINSYLYFLLRMTSSSLWSTKNVLVAVIESSKLPDKPNYYHTGSFWAAKYGQQNCGLQRQGLRMSPACQ